MYFPLERVRRADDRQIMRLTGDIDLAVADDLRFALTAALTGTKFSELDRRPFGGDLPRLRRHHRAP